MLDELLKTETTIIDRMPHKKPFLFIDQITQLTEERIEGSYFLDQNLDFYKGHYPEYPITPGVILTEIMAQIGLVALGIHLLDKKSAFSSPDMSQKVPVLSTTDIKFRKIVTPDQRVYVVSEKKLFKHNKLICKTKLLNINNEILAEGILSGFILEKTNKQ